MPLPCCWCVTACMSVVCDNHKTLPKIYCKGWSSVVSVCYLSSLVRRLNPTARVVVYATAP